MKVLPSTCLDHQSRAITTSQSRGSRDRGTSSLLPRWNSFPRPVGQEAQTLTLPSAQSFVGPLRNEPGPVPEILRQWHVTIAAAAEKLVKP